jgi:hypothetical protein
MGFVEDTVALGKVFLQVLRFSPVNINPPLLRIHSYIIWGMDKDPLAAAVPQRHSLRHRKRISTAQEALCRNTIKLVRAKLVKVRAMLVKVRAMLVNGNAEFPVDLRFIIDLLIVNINVSVRCLTFLTQQRNTGLLYVTSELFNDSFSNTKVIQHKEHERKLP